MLEPLPFPFPRLPEFAITAKKFPELPQRLLSAVVGVGEWMLIVVIVGRLQQRSG